MGVGAWAGARDVSAGATGTTAVTLNFSDTITLFQLGGQILPNIIAVRPKFTHSYVPALRSLINEYVIVMYSKYCRPVYCLQEKNPSYPQTFI